MEEKLKIESHIVSNDGHICCLCSNIGVVILRLLLLRLDFFLLEMFHQSFFTLHIAEVSPQSLADTLGCNSSGELLQTKIILRPE